MSAISYFCKEEPNLKISFPNPKPKIVVQEHHKLNYLLITLMSREVSDTLYEFAKLKIVTYEGLKNFEYRVNGDNDFLFTNKRHKGAIKQLSQDFQTGETRRSGRSGWQWIVTGNGLGLKMSR